MHGSTDPWFYLLPRACRRVYLARKRNKNSKSILVYFYATYRSLEMLDLWCLYVRSRSNEWGQVCCLTTRHLCPLPDDHRNTKNFGRAHPVYDRISLVHKGHNDLQRFTSLLRIDVQCRGRWRRPLVIRPRHTPRSLAPLRRPPSRVQSCLGLLLRITITLRYPGEHPTCRPRINPRSVPYIIRFCLSLPAPPSFSPFSLWRGGCTLENAD
jgi:hypothetical protein